MARIGLTDWLYRNGYGHIYEEWLVNTANSLVDWVKEKYSEIWREYQAAKE